MGSLADVFQLETKKVRKNSALLTIGVFVWVLLGFQMIIKVVGGPSDAAEVEGAKV